MKRTSISVFLVILLLFCGAPHAGALTPIDIADSDNEESIQLLVDLGALEGYEDGSFRPERAVSRAEMAKILVTALAETERTDPDAPRFHDTAGHWASAFIDGAAALGVVSGYPDGSFRPDDKVSIGEVVTMLLRALGYNDTSVADALAGPQAWPAGYMDLAERLLIGVAGYDPAVPADRGAVAGFLADALKLPIGTTSAGAWIDTGNGGDTILARLTGERAIPPAIAAVMDSVTALAVKCAARLDGAYGDKYAALLAAGRGRDDPGYADLVATLNDFRAESGARYVYLLTDVNPDDDFFEITVDGSEEPDDWMAQYEIEGQFLAAQAGLPAAAMSAWSDEDGVSVWSAFAPVYSGAGIAVGILGVDFPAEIVSEYPAWNRDSEDWNGAEYEYDPVRAAMNAFEEAVDVSYAEAVIEKLRSFGNNPDLGFRNAGSPAEIAAGDYIAAEMERFGFTVEKDPVTLDTWEFKHASLRFTDADGKRREIDLAAEMIDFSVADRAYELVYVGKGTEADYEGLDVAGKVVLADINQVEDWWINWPAYQAKAKGAAALIAGSVGGYATYTKDTLGVQDYCGPADVPALNVSTGDAEDLKAAIEAGGGRTEIRLTVDSRVKYGGTAYNIIAELPGKSADAQAIAFIAHYDAYFRAFDDNSTGVAALMGIAKALSDSGYKPERPFRFVFHAGEEWGFADSRYDWAAGAWAETQKHPEFSENTFMTFNLDGGLIDGAAAGVRLRAPYEFANLFGRLGRSIDGNPLGGLTVSSPLWTWTEGWPYATAGIPVIDSGLADSDSDASYHSSSDTAEANNYDREVYAFGHKLYGSLAILLDHARVRDADYVDFFNAFVASLPEDEALREAAEAAKTAAANLNARLAAGVTDAQAPAFNKAMNALYKKVQ
ncbi:MAG: S-layer homology domain-containing protein, partial [Clostridiales Family XIII bacterium]|nr:S-layer homology domain-containing protein [Clostridiales Family XIII bacterium]